MVTKRLSRKLQLAGLLLALVAGMIATSACNAWHGAGKDVEHAGKDMQHQ